MTPLERLKTRLDIRLNDHLCEMRPDYDDSITGFNEAWDIARHIFAEEIIKDDLHESRDELLAAAKSIYQAVHGDTVAVGPLWGRLHAAIAKVETLI